MARPLSVIEQEIRGLSAPEQESLLRALLEELDGPADAGVEAAWLKEAQRRSAELESGSVTCVPGEDVFAEIDRRLGR
jgi:putative addiction module component (TIGR02574 family)